MAALDFQGQTVWVTGAGKGIGFVTEDFAFKEVFRQAAAVQRDELFAVAPTEIVQATGDQFLAGAGLAEQEDRGVGIGNAQNLLQHADKCR